MVGGRIDNVLLVRAGAQICALPLRHVNETMRPLPVAPLAGVPPFVEGAAVVRGEPAPVVLLSVLLGGERRPATRFVSIRSGERRVLLAVDAVLGVAQLPDTGGVPLLADAAGGTIDVLGALDRDLLAVLDASRLVPDDVWREIEAGGTA
jgi:purine-binding chemotaxis protein CheW